MLKLAREPDSPKILQQFGTRLSSTIQQFFADSNSFDPTEPLTAKQQAFMHSLQLYDLRSVMRLIANYDAGKGLKVVLPGIEKSCRSLMVIRQLEQYTKNSGESAALASYKSKLEEALAQVLKCSRLDLYEEDILAEKMVVVSAAPQRLRYRFFSNRLVTLFSPDYRTYLLLKNRYFLKRLKRLVKNPNHLKKQQSRLTELASKYENDEVDSVEQLAENLDFRMIEELVKEQITKSAESSVVKTKSTVLAEVEQKTKNSSTDVTKTDVSTASPQESQSATINETQAVSFYAAVNLENQQESSSAYERLCLSYAEPLQALSESFGPVPECSSPYFRSRVEEYGEEFANYFRQLHGDDLQVIAASHNFTLELLLQRGHEYKATERWGVVSKFQQGGESIYFRSLEAASPVLERKAEWSMLIQGRLPFTIQFPLEKTKLHEIEKEKSFVFQIGTAFFDQGHKDKLDEYPDVFFKLMFSGHLLTGKNAVVYVEEDPYFTTTLEQMWRCRGLLYLLLIAVSQRFAIELSPTLQDYLVELLPATLDVSGSIIESKSSTELLNN